MALSMAAPKHPTPENLPPDCVYVTGTGQRLVGVHQREQACYDHGCVLHSPTDPHQDWPTLWVGGAMYRVCPHDHRHPDKDQVGYDRRTYGPTTARAYSEHVCDGCCWMAEEKAARAAKRKKRNR